MPEKTRMVKTSFKDCAKWFDFRTNLEFFLRKEIQKILKIIEILKDVLVQVNLKFKSVLVKA